MGCIHPQPVSFNDETVRSRERKLGLHNYTIDQIKEVINEHYKIHNFIKKQNI